MKRATIHYRVEYSMAEGQRYDLYCQSVDLIVAERRLAEVIAAKEPALARIVEVRLHEIKVWAG